MGEDEGAEVHFRDKEETNVLRQSGWEGTLKENGYMYLYGWDPSLFTWNYHNIVNWLSVQFSLVAQLCLTLQPYGLQHTWPPCPSPTSRVYSNSCASSRWCHPAISSSVIPFSSCSQSFPATGSFQMSQLFTSGGQSIGVSASTSILPMNIQDIYSSMDWLDLLSVQGTLKSLLQHHSSKASVLWRSAFFILSAILQCKIVVFF